MNLRIMALTFSTTAMDRAQRSRILCIGTLSRDRLGRVYYTWGLFSLFVFGVLSDALLWSIGAVGRSGFVGNYATGSINIIYSSHCVVI